MSKEKQKFFRLSAFNAEKKKMEKQKLQDKNKEEPKKVNGKQKQEISNNRRNNTKENAKNKTPIPQTNKNNKKETIDNSQNDTKYTKSQKADKAKLCPVLDRIDLTSKSKSPLDLSESSSENSDEDKTKDGSSSSSSSECSSSSSSDDDDDSSSDTDSTEEVDEKKNQSNNIKIPNVFSRTNEKIGTFGSISGITVDKDEPWGFAAAAAKLMTDKVELPFGKVKEHNEDVKKVVKDKENEKNTQNGSVEKNKGLGQLKGLFDGLSHLFAAPSESRASRSTPNYNPNRRKPKEDEQPKQITKTIPKPEPEPIRKIEVEDNVKTTRSKNRDKSSETETTKKQLTPSNLVKTAVNCKRLESEKRTRPVKTEESDGSATVKKSAETSGSQCGLTGRSKKRDTASHISYQLTQIGDNQTGKIRFHLPPKQSLPQNKKNHHVTFFHPSPSFLLPFSVVGMLT